MIARILRHSISRTKTWTEDPHLISIRMLYSHPWLDTLVNHERTGVPPRAGTDTSEGFDLQRMHRLLDLLGNPHVGNSYKTIHIAGTKGKGSTAAFLTAILKECGQSVGTYTSPHILSLSERILINGEQCDIQELISRLVPVLESSEVFREHSYSQFEVLTALALKHFEEQGVDVAVIETGLGGTRDATNVIPGEALIAACITSIGKDHLEALGGSQESIVATKAGILRSGRPVVIGVQQDAHVETLIKMHAHEKGCVPIICVGSTHNPTCSSASNRDGVLFPSGMDLPLPGRHQRDNAALAFHAASFLDTFEEEKALKGLQKTKPLLGRFTRMVLGNTDDQCYEEKKTLSSKGLHELGTIPVVLDGAHTPESAKALVATAMATFPPDTQYAVVVAMAQDKDHTSFLREIAETVPNLLFIGFTEVPIGGGASRSASTGALLASWMAVARRKKGAAPTRSMIQASVKSAIERAAEELGMTRQPHRAILVTGSLHVVRAALQAGILRAP